MAGNAPDLDPLDEAAVDAVRAQGLVDIEEADSLDALKASPRSVVWLVRTSDRRARR